MLLSLFGQAYIITISSLRFMIGRWRFPCILYSPTFSVIIPFATLPIILRTWRIIVINELASLQRLWNALKQTSNDKEQQDGAVRVKKTLSLWKFWLSTKFVVFAFVLATLLHFAVWFIIAGASGDFKLYFSFVRSCSINSFTSYAIFAQIILYMAAALILLLFMFVRKSYANDMFSIKIEMIIVVIQWFVIFLIFTIIGALWWKIYVTAERYWPYGYFIFIGCHIDTFFTAWMPLILSFRERTVQIPTESVELLDMMHKTSEFQKVKLKLMSSAVYMSNENLRDEKLLDKFVLCLVNEKEFKDKYLNTSFTKTLARFYSDRQIMEMLEKQMKKEHEQTKIQKKQLMNDEQQKFVAQAEDIEEVADPDLDSFDIEITDEMIQKASENMKVKQKIKIKLAIIEVRGTRMKLRKLISPIASHVLDFFPEIGMFHSALLIGPWLMDFNDSGLCIPRKCLSDSAIITYEIATVENTDQILALVDQIAKYLIYINGNIDYNKSGDCVNTMNCQDFVDSLLAHLKLENKVNKESALGKFIHKLRTKGSSGLSLYPSTRFLQHFQFSPTIKRFKFTTHTEIDKFVEDLEQIDPMLRINFNEEYEMLKAFDRAMWMKLGKAAERLKIIDKKLAKQEWEMKLINTDNPEELSELKKIKREQERTKLELKECMRILEICNPQNTDCCPFGDPATTSTKMI
jgi:hypothetical protein